MLACKDLNWSTPNARLYNKAFTGWAKIIPHCQHCLYEDHNTAVCPHNPNPPYLGWFPSPYLLSPHQPQPPTPLPAPTPIPAPVHGSYARNEVCRNFNDNCCRFARCCYLHICSECFAPHPALMCPHRTVPLASGLSGRSCQANRARQNQANPYPSSRQ